MRYQSISFRSFGGIARWIEPSALALGVACASVFGLGCGQAQGESESPRPTDLAIENALRAVESCQAQARDCFTSGGDANVCEEQLRSCLMSLLPEAGTPPPRPERDGGPAENDHGRDGSRPMPPRDGAPPSDPPSPEGGTPPDHPSPDAAHRTLPDAAKGALTDPVGNDGGPAVHSCVNDLRACLASSAKPSVCAEGSRICLSDLRDGG
jgi:hypothetical protein